MKGKLKELQLQLNYVCYDTEMVTKLNKVWEAYFALEAEIEKFHKPDDIKPVCPGCNGVIENEYAPYCGRTCYSRNISPIT